MKKTIISLAIAAGMAASAAAAAAPEVYGVLHASIDSADTGASTDSLEMKSQTSAIGVKGSEDLGDGMKAFYQAEFQVDITEAGGLTGRDQFIGLQGGMGTVKFGSMSTNWKQMGGSIDPLYRTSLEGRGSLAMQSKLHGGSGGRLNGRAGDLLQYSSPKMGGMQLVINTTFDNANTTGPAAARQDIDETMGVGFRYAAKDFNVYVDMIDMSQESAAGSNVVVSESATKIGGSYEMGALKIGAQMEQTEDLMGNDYRMLSVAYKIDANNDVYFSTGQAVDNDTTGVKGSTSFALAYDHKMSKATDLYVGYGSRDDNAAASADYSVITAGMRVKF